MARRRRGSSTPETPRRSIISTPVYRVPPLIQVYPPRRTLIDLTPFEDRRRYHPLKKSVAAGVLDYRDARRIIERDRRFHDRNKKLTDFMPSFKLGFMIPEKVVRCVRRARRREVIFALNKQGKGARSRHRRRDQFSDISCKR